MKHKSFRALVLAVPSSGLLLARPFLHFLCLNIYQPHSFLSTGLLASGREGNGTHSSTLTWGIPGTEEPGGRSPWGCEESDMTERLHFHFSLSCTGEGNGNPLQYSGL